MKACRGKSVKSGIDWAFEGCVLGHWFNYGSDHLSERENGLMVSSSNLLSFGGDCFTVFLQVGTLKIKYDSNRNCFHLNYIWKL